MGLIHWISGTAAGLRGFARRMADDRRGNVAMIMGLVMPVLVLVTMAGVDIHRMATVRANLQDALDAATLAAARSDYVKTDDLNRVGRAALKANLAGYNGIRLNDTDITFVLSGEEIVVANAKVDVKAIAAHIFLPPYGTILDEWLPVAAHSEVDRATKDIEVSLVLDITGSMAGNRLGDLKTAANDLVDIVVQDVQTINQTRMALVPYSMGVNPGTYVTATRGAITGSTAISGASWMSSGWVSTKIGGISIANPGVFTVSNHGLVAGNFVWISGVGSSSSNNLGTLLNDKAYKVAWSDTNSFTLEGVSTSGKGTYTANSGSFRKCQISTCEVVVTSNNHGLTTGDDVRITGVAGMTEINNSTDDGTNTQSNLFRTVTKQNDNTFSLNGVKGANVSTYSSGGSVQCLEQGCQSYLFQNLANNAWRVRPISSCVSERIGGDAYTDVAAATSHVGRSYSSSDNGCLTSVIQPLTSDRGILHTQINGYAAVGSTAGQIGVGWGWYMISPTFGSIFPSANRPAAYSNHGLLKVVILMTDGEFNTPYCNGVIAGAVSGSGSTAQHINCAATNGNPFAQAVTMCTAMKAKGVLVYTVGFDLAESTGAAGAVDTARDVMTQCATNPDYVYLPENGASLKSAFAEIGRSISQLRISK
ncbi:MAG: pilus assembly protein [Brevundimonas sp.]|nr:MAG: pilus assembly protein [Brevundimonas sp.]